MRLRDGEKSGQAASGERQMNATISSVGRAGNGAAHIAPGKICHGAWTQLNKKRDICLTARSVS
jgi:hypothetical protein